MAKIPTIRRRDAAATRAAILEAAHQRFLRENYDSVGLRDIAGDAGVDAALISRYFGSKEGLFRETVLHQKEGGPPFQDAKSADELPEVLTQVVLEDADEDRMRRMEMFIIMLRSASSPRAGAIIRELVHEQVLEPLSALIDDEHGEMRAHMMLAILMGISVLRTIMKVDRFNADDAEDEVCADTFRHLFETALKG